jgi:HEPN domain-containing protein
MKPLTQEWVDKAEGDFATASREIKARKAPNYDAVCFHAQQCVEKYLKARLQEEGIAFKKIFVIQDFLRTRKLLVKCLRLVLKFVAP